MLLLRVVCNVYVGQWLLIHFRCLFPRNIWPHRWTPSRKMWVTPLEKSSTSASQLEVSPRNTERNNRGGGVLVSSWNVFD